MRKNRHGPEIFHALRVPGCAEFLPKRPITVIRNWHAACDRGRSADALAETLFILNDPPYGTERSYNALQFAGALSKRESEQVNVFLIGRRLLPEARTVIVLGGGVGGVVAAREHRAYTHEASRHVDTLRTGTSPVLDIRTDED